MVRPFCCKIPTGRQTDLPIIQNQPEPRPTPAERSSMNEKTNQSEEAQAIATLQKATTLIDERTWIRGSTIKLSNDRPSVYASPEAISWCLYGSLLQAASLLIRTGQLDHEDSLAAIDKATYMLADAVMEEADPSDLPDDLDEMDLDAAIGLIAGWNDNLAKDALDAKRMMRKPIERAER